MKKLKYSLTALALIALAACNKTEMPGFLSDPDAVRIEAAVGALTKSNPLGDSEEQAKFNEGDRISIANGGGGVVYKTVVYKLQNGIWAPENPSEYLKWDKSKLWFQLEYPAGYSTLPADQSTIEKMALADDMYMSWNMPEIPEDRTLSTKLWRQNALVKIKIAGYQDQYDKDVHKINFVTIGQGSTWGSSDRNYMVAKPLVQDADGKVITDETFSAGTIGYTYSGIVCTNETKKDDLTFISLQISGAQGTTPETLTVKGVPKLKMGYAYTFDLYIGKNTVKVGSVTVNEWTKGVDLPEGETDAVDTWDGKTTTAFATQDAEGNTLGDAEDKPILISNCAQLAYLAQQVNNGYTYENKYFKLADDLNLADKKWTPIGAGYSTPFKGNFDGNNHEIFGLKVETDNWYAGLFGYIYSGSIKNIKICSGSVKTSGSYAGGIVGDLYNSTMENCTASVNVSGTGNDSGNVGGLAGNISGSTVSNCHFLSGEIVGYGYVGGIVGHVQNSDKSTVKDCSANASVKGSECVGGLCGWFGNGDHEFSNCTMKGSVTVTKNSCGGLVGSLYDSKGTFKDCKFEGSIKKDGDNVSNTGIAIGADNSNVTFENCVCTIDEQTKTSLNGKKVGNIKNPSSEGDKVRSDGYTYPDTDIKVIVK